MRFRETWHQYLDSFLKLVGVRAYQTGPRTIDPYNIYGYEDSADDKRTLRFAVFVAILFHVILFIVRFAGNTRVFIPENRSVIVLRNLAGPPSVAGGGQPRSAPKKLEVPKPKPQPIPFPDPTPDKPEPLYEPVPDPAPAIVAQISSDLAIGDITGPPGKGGFGGNSRGPGVGEGPGGPGEGVHQAGGGVLPPRVLAQPLPQYTEQARKARVEGIVVLQAVVRKDGTVDSFRVLRGLGYGLDESAINTIATKWRFRPGTLNGQPVDVQANIEVAFKLY